MVAARSYVLILTFGALFNASSLSLSFGAEQGCTHEEGASGNDGYPVLFINGVSLRFWDKNRTNDLPTEINTAGLSKNGIPFYYYFVDCSTVVRRKDGKLSYFHFRGADNIRDDKPFKEVTE